MSEHLRVELSPARLQIEPGGLPVESVVTLTNLGRVVEECSVQLVGLDPDWYSAPNASVGLFPDASEQLRIRFQVPKHQGLKAGSYPFRILVNSGSSSAAQSAEGVLDVLGQAAYKLDLAPLKRSARWRAKYRVLLENKGRVDVRLRLEARDEEEACRFDFPKTDEPLLEVEEKLELPLHVRRTKWHWLGRDEAYPFRLTAEPMHGRGDPQTVQGQFTSVALLPSNLLRYVTYGSAGVLVMAFAAAMLTGSAGQMCLAAARVVPIVRPMCSNVDTRPPPQPTVIPTSLPATSVPTPLPTSSPPSPTAVPSPASGPLAQKVSKVFAALPPKASAVFQNANGSELVEVDASAQVPAASTIKLPLMIEVFRQAGEGQLSLDQKHTVTSDKVVGGTGVLQNEVGRSLTTMELLEVTLTFSDNTGGNMLIDLVGMESVNETMKKLGFTQTRLNRKFLDFEAQRRGLENVSSAGDMAEMLLKIQRGELISASASGDMLRILSFRGQKTDPVLDFMGRKLEPRPDIFAHINGLLPGVRNDVGLIQQGDQAVVLAIFLRGQADERAAEEAIAEAGADILAAMLAQ